MGAVAKATNFKRSNSEATNADSSGKTLAGVTSKKALKAKRKAEEEARNRKPMTRMGDTSYRELNDSFGNSSQMGGERRFMGEVSEGLGGNRVLGEADWRRRSREVQKWGL